jgi:hypothetical protein
MRGTARLETTSKILGFLSMLNQSKNCPYVHYTILFSIGHRPAAYLINKVTGMELACSVIIMTLCGCGSTIKYTGSHLALISSAQ